MNLLFVPGHIVLAEHKVMFNYIFILNFTVVQRWHCSMRLTEYFVFVFISSYTLYLFFYNGLYCSLKLHLTKEAVDRYFPAYTTPTK